MNLAICSVGELFGGVERHILGMCTWLHRQGQQPLLILFHDRELAKQAREIGVEPVILATRGSFDLGAVRRLGTLLAVHEIDVVHAHGYRAVVNCALARRYHRFGMVRTVHGLVESAGWWTWQGFKGIAYTRLERYFGRRANAAVVYVTEDLRQRHLAKAPGSTGITIHNGIDPLNKEDYPRPADLEPGWFHLAAVGRVTRIKGLEFALEAMTKLDPELKVVLNIIGTGPLVGELKAQAEELGVSDRVRFLGFKKNVYDYLAHIDALIMPSLHEGLPYTILEAMSLGTALIVSRTGGLIEVVADREHGLLVDVGDVQELAAAIVLLAGDPDLAARLGEAGRQRQASTFTLETMGTSSWNQYLASDAEIRGQQ